MLDIRAGIHIMPVTKVNREDPDQKQSDLGLRSLFGLFGRQLVFEISEHLPDANLPHLQMKPNYDISHI